MKLQEADAKSLLVAQGLPVPAWAVAHTAAEARAAAERFLARRRRAGRHQGPGPRRRPRQGRRREAGRLGRRGGGRRRRRSWAWTSRASPSARSSSAPAADIVKEFYLAAVLDRAERGDPADGLGRGRGRDRDRSPRRTPRRSSGVHADPNLGLLDFQARDLAFAMGLGAHLKAAVRDRQGPGHDDARLRRRPRRDQPAGHRPRGRRRTARPVERLVCLDAKITLDDSALARHPGLEDLRDPDEEAPGGPARRARPA